MLFLRGLATSITMVPSRLRHPWDFYSKHIFLTLVFFFSKCIFTIVTKDSAEKGETALGMRKEITNPIQTRWCQAGWVFKAVMMPLCRGARQWPQVLMHTWALQSCVMVVWGVCSTLHKWNTKLYNKLLLFFRFSGGKAVCTPDFCLEQGTYTEGGKSL